MTAVLIARVAEQHRLPAQAFVGNIDPEPELAALVGLVEEDVSNFEIGALGEVGRRWSGLGVLGLEIRGVRPLLRRLALTICEQCLLIVGQCARFRRALESLS